ncbi:MAG TPA: DNA polymerase III subunit delta [Gemmatimonadaceae bacterium]|jgi:DNA polymerase-3 subunit delta
MPDDRAFYKSIASGSFERAYSIHGEEEFLKDAAVRQLLAAALDPGTRDFNLDIRDAGSVTAEVLASLLATPPLMAERRVVVVRDAASLRKESRAVVDHFLEHGASPTGAADIVLVLVFGPAERGKPDRALVQRTFALETEPLAGNRVPKWIAHHAQTALGVSVTEDAAALLFEHAGNDLAALAGELDKLASYTNGGAIDEAAVAAVVGVRRGETLGDFLDAVGRRDAPRALALLAHVLDQPKVSAVPIVMALTAQTQALAWGLAMRAKGTSAGRLEREYYDLLKSVGGAYTGRPWGEAVRSWVAALDVWDDAALDRAMDALLAADIALKETRVSSDEEILARLVLAMCAAAHGPASRHAAVA